MNYKNALIILVLGMTLNCIHPLPQGTNKVPAPVLSPDKMRKVCQMGGDTLTGKNQTIEIRKNHDTSDMAAQMLQGVMMWCRHAQVGQDRPVERTGGERGTHTGIDPGCPSCLSPNILFNQTRWSSCSKMLWYGADLLTGPVEAG